MELRYCELCGEIIKIQGDKESSHKAPHLCSRCQAKKNDNITKVTPKAEEISFRDAVEETEEKEFDCNNTPTELSLQNIGVDDLKLFSEQTVARKKNEAEAKENTRSFSKIRLLDPDAPTQTDWEETPENAVTSTIQKESVEENISSESYLNEEPSEKTVQKETAKLKTQKQVQEPATPSSADKQMKFSCPICHCTLAITPVKTKSRLSCPRCKSKMTIDPEKNIHILEIGNSSTKAKKIKPVPTKDQNESIINSKLLKYNPEEPPPAETFQEPENNEDLITCENTEDLSSLINKQSLNIPEDTGKACFSNPVSKDDKQLLLENEALSEIGEEATFQTIPDPNQEEQEEYNNNEAYQRLNNDSVTISSAVKPLLLGIVLATPFYAGAALLYFSQTSKICSAYCRGLGEIVKEVFNSIFGG